MPKKRGRQGKSKTGGRTKASSCSSPPWTHRLQSLSPPVFDVTSNGMFSLSLWWSVIPQCFLDISCTIIIIIIFTLSTLSSSNLSEWNNLDVKVLSKSQQWLEMWMKPGARRRFTFQTVLIEPLHLCLSGDPRDNPSTYTVKSTFCCFYRFTLRQCRYWIKVMLANFSDANCRHESNSDSCCCSVWNWPW